jgi:hypothetical protein
MDTRLSESEEKNSPITAVAWLRHGISEIINNAYGFVV